MQIAHEFGLILQVEEVEEKFEESWKLYTSAIIEYAQASKAKPKELKHALRDDDVDGKPFLTIIRCI